MYLEGKQEGQKTAGVGGSVKKGCKGVGGHFLFNVFDGSLKGSEVCHKVVSRVLLVRITAGNREFQLVLNFLLGGIYTFPEGCEGWVEREGCPFSTGFGLGC